MNWYVVYTKPKWEKKVAEKLNAVGVVAYCPMVIKERQWSDRKKKVAVPLFSSYVFVQLDEGDRQKVFAVTGVVRYLFWLGQPAVVKEVEIAAIQQWLSAPDTYDVTLDQWQPGEKVVVPHGVFKDQEAVVKEVKSTYYVLVLEALGCVLRVAKK